jgi:prolyl-tRNA synthetase
MRWSKTLHTTLRDEPQEAEIASHKLLIRAGYVRRVSGGLYTFTPFGVRVLRKVENIVREEMNRAGAHEILMPALQPIELWNISGRASQMGASMFSLKDRQNRTMVLGPTHEEVVTDYIAHEISSYRQLPCTVYQIQTKFRDEIRPRFGLMRAKEFIMKDAYSFDVSMEAADISYKAMYDAYVRIFERCGLDAKAVEADTGNIGGSHSHEFMVLAPSGEDGIINCSGCGYSANQERAERNTSGSEFSTKNGEPEDVPTPGARTVEEAAQAVGVSPEQIVKSLVYLADGKPVLAIVQGTREINECKLRRVLGCSILELADDETTVKHAGPVGSLGPAGVNLPIYADTGLKGARDVVTGANKEGFHTRHVSIEDSVTVKAWVDIATVVAGDNCPKCKEELSVQRGIEVGHVFKLGTKYSEVFDASFLSAERTSNVMVMGCYGIGVTRTMQAVIEQNFDENGIVWPASVSPYQVTLLELDAKKDENCRIVTENLEKELEENGIDVFVDDRDERPGVKFKDADLIGCTVRVVVGKRALEKGGVEVHIRKTGETRIIPLTDVIPAIKKALAE